MKVDRGNVLKVFTTAAWYVLGYNGIYINTCKWYINYNVQLIIYAHYSLLFFAPSENHYFDSHSWYAFSQKPLEVE